MSEEKVHLSIYVSPEVRQLIRLAAARADKQMREWMTDVIEQKARKQVGQGTT